MPPGAGHRDMSAYLGLDLSTQSLTAVLLDDDGLGGVSVSLKWSVAFEKILPQFGARNGMRALPGGGADDDAARITSPVRMWVLALESLCRVLERPPWRERLARVRSVSVSAQQHGAVYLTEHGAQMLRVLGDARRWEAAAAAGAPQAVPLDALFSEHCFSLLDVPIWADSSAQPACAEVPSPQP
mmetsp:Transcript_21659/g.66317  ORF Transcript_21659/g.66317 Transcript_21659/m.66317 type:complete len:185 (-) Transcript_21659:58-612(-)